MEEQKFAPKLLAYAKEEKQFQTRNWTIFPRSTFLQQSSLAKDDDCGFKEIPFALNIIGFDFDYSAYKH